MIQNRVNTRKKSHFVPHFLLGTVLGLLVLALSSCLTMKDPYQAKNLPIAGRFRGGTLVKTRYGILGGQWDRAGCYIWRGIPYAAPPVRELRWRAPQEPRAWGGTRPAREFRSQAVQILPLIERVGGSEDCLYLNVWRPADDRDGLPVVFWIHGGANTAGAANAFTDYYGQAIAARQGLVFVSINYRLGPLGWLRDPSLAPPGASAEEASGNFGLLDIIAALRWVRGEIASFGGDPDRVTVMGESAGGLNVLSLLLAKSAKGLFSGAIAMSPLTTSYSAAEGQTRADALLIDLIMGDKLRRGRGYDDPDRARKAALCMNAAERAAYLRSVAPERLYASLRGGRTGMCAWPTVFLDGVLLPEMGFDLFASGDFPGKVPLLIGSTRDELGVFLFIDPGLSFGQQEYSAAFRYGSELWRARSVDGVARAISGIPEAPPVFSYRFDWGAAATNGSSVLLLDLGRRLGAFHGLDVPFFLGTDTVMGPLLGSIVFTPENRLLREALTARIIEYIGSFARTGNPNGPWMEPEWPDYGKSGGKWLVFGDPDAPGPVSVKEENSTEKEIAERMLTEIGEDGARRAMFYLPFFLRGFPFQAP